MRAEHERGPSGRFSPGLPRSSDGQLLFLLHMLAHAKKPKEGCPAKWKEEGDKTLEGSAKLVGRVGEAMQG